MSYEKGPSSCTSILIGKNATTDGSIIIGRNEDAKASWPKHFIVHQHQEFATEQKFVSKMNKFKLELPKIRYKYTATPEWTDKEGVYEEDGFNEFGVGMSATESTYSNPTALGADPLVDDGIGEEAMVTCVLPYVKTARAAIQRLGKLVETYGTCESNGVLFADKNEAWYMEMACGHQWVAQRIPDDGYAVAANQIAIQKIDFDDSDNFMFKQDIKKFVEENHLNPNPATFNFRDIFGTRDLSDQYYNTPRVWWGQQEFSGKTDEKPTSLDLSFIKTANRKLSVDDAKLYLASHFEKTEYDPLNDSPKSKLFRPISLAKTQESHVLQIRPDIPADIGCIQWLAMGVAAQSVYVPFYLGMSDTPRFYKTGKLPYDAKSAYWIYKLAGVLVDGHYNEFGGRLKDVQNKVKIELAHRVKQSDQKAQTLNSSELTEYLTDQNKKNAKYSADEYKKLIADLITDSTDFSPLNFKTDMNL